MLNVQAMQIEYYKMFMHTIKICFWLRSFYIAADIGAWTPLIWACYKGYPKTVETLIQHGADINSRGMHHVSGDFHTCILKYKCSYIFYINIDLCNETLSFVCNQFT